MIVRGLATTPNEASVKRSSNDPPEHDRPGSSSRRPTCNRQGLLYATRLDKEPSSLPIGCGVSQATSTAEREQALDLIDDHRGESERCIILGADKAYDITQFVHDVRGRSHGGCRHLLL